MVRSSYTRYVPLAESPEEPRVLVLAPDQALKRARPLPRHEDLVIEDVPDEEWVAFLEALAETCATPDRVPSS